MHIPPWSADERLRDAVGPMHDDIMHSLGAYVDLTRLDRSDDTSLLTLFMGVGATPCTPAGATLPPFDSALVM